MGKCKNQIRMNGFCSHHHHVVPLARISQTISHHFSLSFIASGRFSGLHPVYSHSCCMYVRASCPAFAWPYVGVHRSTSLTEFVLYFDLRPGPKMLFQGDTPEGSDAFQWPVIERDRVGGLRLMIWDKVKVPLCHYSDAPEESNLWTAWQLFPLDDD